MVTSSPCYDRYGGCWCHLPAHHEGRHRCVCEASWEDVGPVKL